MIILLHFILFILENNWTHVYKIPGRELLCSVNHNFNQGLANFGAFDLRNNKITFSFEEVSGGNQRSRFPIIIKFYMKIRDLEILLIIIKET
mgnify:CR=1 FL=1